MMIGYALVSTDDQDRDIQPDAPRLELSKEIEDLEPTLTRHGNTAKALAELLDTKPGEVRALFRQTLRVECFGELKEQTLNAGLPV